MRGIHERRRLGNILLSVDYTKFEIEVWSDDASNLRKDVELRNLARNLSFISSSSRRSDYLNQV